jgi:hypothetical protein
VNADVQGQADREQDVMSKTLPGPDRAVGLLGGRAELV